MAACCFIRCCGGTEEDDKGGGREREEVRRTRRITRMERGTMRDKRRRSGWQDGDGRKCGGGRRRGEAKEGGDEEKQKRGETRWRWRRRMSGRGGRGGGGRRADDTHRRGQQYGDGRDRLLLLNGHKDDTPPQRLQRPARSRRAERRRSRMVTTRIADGRRHFPLRLRFKPSCRQLIAQELIAPIVQLADDLSPDICFQSDNSPAPYIFERSLDPYLQWTSCLEEPTDEDTLPSRQQYLKSYEIIPYAFYPRAEEVVIDDDEEEEDDDEEASEEGSYSEYSEGELSEEEQEEEGTGSEWEVPPEEATRMGTEVEDPEAEQKREEIATGKRQLAFASEASLRIGSDPTRNPGPPRPEDGDPAAATSRTAQRRRRRSPSSSSPTRPLVRPCTNAGDRPSTSDAAPPTP
ncbi:hypothetical protein CBR_g24345 [Chara braunii]|uniref:Uncharacterized protein n=1 Tax=Chara braunii TaxID=69332 RepID=A0A388JMH7_CHABU|nr:hypothetical protein CBR_g24345 [Chara braunii]|eukprot:GBG58997.1 hypothetical protein CBR_g24345 [Chara braunii]